MRVRGTTPFRRVPPYSIETPNKRPFLRGPVRTPSASFDKPLKKYPQQ